MFARFPFLEGFLFRQFALDQLACQHREQDSDYPRRAYMPPFMIAPRRMCSQTRPPQYCYELDLLSPFIG